MKSKKQTSLIGKNFYFIDKNHKFDLYECEVLSETPFIGKCENKRTKENFEREFDIEEVRFFSK